MTRRHQLEKQPNQTQEEAQPLPRRAPRQLVRRAINVVSKVLPRSLRAKASQNNKGRELPGSDESTGNLVASLDWIDAALTPWDAPLDEAFAGLPEDVAQKINSKVAHYAEVRQNVQSYTSKYPEIFSPKEISEQMRALFEQLTPEVCQRIKKQYIEHGLVAGDESIISFFVENLDLRAAPKPKYILHPPNGRISGEGCCVDSEHVEVSDYVLDLNETKELGPDAYARFMSKYLAEHPESFDIIMRGHVSMVAHEAWHTYQRQSEADYRAGRPCDARSAIYDANENIYISQSEYDSSPLYFCQILEAEAYKVGAVFKRRIIDEDFSPVTDDLFETPQQFYEILKTTPEEYKKQLIADYWREVSDDEYIAWENGLLDRN